jgi:hypothetical protein
MLRLNHPPTTAQPSCEKNLKLIKSAQDAAWRSSTARTQHPIHANGATNDQLLSRISAISGRSDDQNQQKTNQIQQKNKVELSS